MFGPVLFVAVTMLAATIAIVVYAVAHCSVFLCLAQAVPTGRGSSRDEDDDENGTQ